MKFENPYIERAICEIHYPPTLAYHDNRVGLCRALMTRKPEFQHWTLNIPQIQLRDDADEKTSSKIFLITSKGSSFLFKAPGVYDNFKALADYLMSETIDEFNIEVLNKFSIRVSYFYEVVEGRFEQLRDLVITQLLSEKIETVSGNLQDVASVLEFEKGGYYFNVKIGPLSPEEITGDVTTDREYFVLKDEVSSTLLVDVDISKEACSTREVRNALQESKVSSKEISRKVIAILEENS